MATASPTPLGSSHFSILNRRPPSRQALRQAPARPTLNHNGSFSAYNSSTAAAEAAAEAGANARHFTSNDSSDDELPMPMKFSALTKALLDGEASILEPTSPINTNQNHNLSGSTAVEARHARSNTPSLPESQRRERDTSPGFASSRGSNRAHSPFPRRVVRLSGSPRSSTLKRTSNLALAKQRHAEQEAAKEPPLDLATPAPVPRTVRIPITSSGNHGSSFGSSGRSGTRYGSGSRATSEEYDGGEEPATIGRAHLGVSLGSVSRYGGATLNRTRFGDDTGMQSSMRVKRLGKVAGSFLSGPARRGRRRQSEEDQERETEAVDGLDAFGSQEPQSQEPGSSQEPESQEPESQPFESQEQISSQVPESNPGSFYSSTHRDFASGSPLGSKENIRHVRVPTPPQSLRHASLLVQENNKPQPSISAQPSFRIPPPRPDLPSTHDQENEAPPTFKRHKPASLVHLDKVEKVALRPQSADFSVLRANPSPERRPLAARSQNTPRRPAPPPPPPKMSLLETATATAGAATTSHANKKRNNIRVNGKSFTRMEIVGRGGSSKVWRVMAENGKVYALKRVSLEDADENAVRGYKGEIDLLKKMEGNDRVVRLLDYEMNDEKQMLSVVGSYFLSYYVLEAN
jgi:serine/threonine-protein kinase TTK/MPS1